jgi:hypothetical protein
MCLLAIYDLRNNCIAITTIIIILLRIIWKWWKIIKSALFELKNLSEPIEINDRINYAIIDWSDTDNEFDLYSDI